MRSTLKRPLLGLVAGSAALVSMSSAAYAAHTVTPSSNLVDGQNVAVAVTGLPGLATASIQQCNNDQGQNFDPVADCAFLSLIEAQTNASGAGSEPAFVVRKEPDGYSIGDVDWKCDPTGAVDGSVTVASPAGQSRVFSTCRIRVVAGPFTGFANESFQDISFAQEQEPVVPEAPLAALMPIGAAAVLAGGYLIVRNRKTTSIA